MRDSLWLLVAFAAIVTLTSAAEGQDGPDAGESRVRCRSGFWPPRDRTVGWNADRHAPALRIKPDDREQPARDRPEWIQWRMTHGAHRSYQNASAEELHARIFEETETMIGENRAAFLCGEATYTLGINEYADLTHDEVDLMMMSEVEVKDLQGMNSSLETIEIHGGQALVGAFDWRNYITMPPVQDQASCGSCYAFATVAAIEAQIAIQHAKEKNKTVVKLSEQYIIDCTFKQIMNHQHNGGCEGGWLDSTVAWLAGKSLPSQDQYRYYSGQTKKHGPCQTHIPDNDYKIGKAMSVAPKSDDEYAEILVQFGPFASAVVGEKNDWPSYKGGIYNNPKCNDQFVNHAVVGMGFGTEGTQDYWVIRNSWGVKWGMKGYMKLARGVHMCGFPSFVVWPIMQ